MEYAEKSSINNSKFENKNIIITGSSGSIGSEVLSRFLKNGSKVVAFYNKNIPNNPQLSTYKISNKFFPIQLDFEKMPKRITDKFKEAMLFLGGVLDILIFCHGKFFPGDFHSINTSNFDRNIYLNVRPNFHILSLATPFLKITKGNVVMISSMETKIVERGDFLHALNKSMINSLVQNSALELASFGVRINAVAPNFVDNEFRTEVMGDGNARYLKQMTNYNLLNKNKLVSPADVADVIMFLASSEANFITGEIISIDCGFELNHDLSFMQKDDIKNNIMEEEEEENIKLELK